VNRRKLLTSLFALGATSAFNRAKVIEHVKRGYRWRVVQPITWHEGYGVMVVEFEVDE